MKRTILTAILTAIALSALPAVAQQSTSSDKGAQAKQAAPNVTEFDKQMAQVQENMKKMQEQMNKLRQTQDPQERQRLMQDHWATMQDTMRMMRGMWGPGMMGCCSGGPMMGGGHMMGWRGMGGYYSNLTPEQMKQRQYMMDQYMGMQQMMMDQMMQSQHWMMPQPSQAPTK